jgi:hypothetical protein
MAEQPLSHDEVSHFIERGFVPLRGAFRRELADSCRALLWEQLGLDPADRGTWTKPVMRLGSQMATPFREAANTPQLHGAFDQLVGTGRWVAHAHLSGTVAVRFPVDGDPGDDGWHIDGAFNYDKQGRGGWVNIRSEGRALLMLFLFSDVGPEDAPTRIRCGSHFDMAAILAPAGEEGLPPSRLSPPPRVHERPMACATGAAGDVYLCHPFLVHAADRHRGVQPRFVAQPGLLWAEPMQIEIHRVDGAYSPVEVAVRRGLGFA